MTCTSWLHTMSITTCDCALQVDIPFHIQGDVVRVIDDIATVHGLQTVGPGWVDEMALVRITYMWVWDFKWRNQVHFLHAECIVL